MDRYIKLKKGNVEIVVDLMGGYVASYKVGGLELIYNSKNYENPQWDGNAKNQFPNTGPVGSTNPVYGKLNEYLIEFNGINKKFTEYMFNGFGFLLPQHGVPQLVKFRPQAVENDRCLVVIDQYTEGMSSMYPFKFKYGVDYTITNDGKLEYFAFAKNNDNKDMLAGMGWHPGFVLHSKAEKYKIIVKNLIAEDGCTLQEGVEYDVAEIINSKNPVVFQHIKSADIVLLYEKEGGKKIPYITMHTNEPNLVLWSKPKNGENQDNFICIEPWNTTPGQISKLTTQDKTKHLAEGDDPALVLKPKEEKTMKVVVNVNEDYVKAIQRSKRSSKTAKVENEREDDGMVR